MQLQFKSASASIRRESGDAIERKKRAHILAAADAARAEKRRVSDATIDSSASKWRYPAASPKS
ncbi:hypothetical protein BTH42_33380 [Burkholderia sp. SRS-W-2-2016]|nr:hypothetical protein BTH42_33380 [Burkholderia sp. SRS-W-2-2016]